MTQRHRGRGYRCQCGGVATIYRTVITGFDVVRYVKCGTCGGLAKVAFKLDSVTGREIIGLLPGSSKQVIEQSETGPSMDLSRRGD
jgi:hypothetical protein